MRAREFLEETVFDILYESAIAELGIKLDYLLEDSAAGSEIKEFILAASALQDLTKNDIGDTYFPVGISVLPEPKFMSLAFFSNDAELTQIRNDDTYVFMFEGRGQTFPPTPDNKLMFRLVFPTKVDFEKFELVLKLKFSEWNIKSKLL